MVICLELSADDLCMVQLKLLQPHHLLLHQNPEWFTFLVPAYTVCPGKKPSNEALVWEKNLLGDKWNGFFTQCTWLPAGKTAISNH